MFGIYHGGFCIRVNRSGACLMTAAVLYSISASQKVATLNTRTWT